MHKRPFRNRDRIIIHHADGRTSKGRVICHNRRNKYGLSVVVLFESERDEIIETFQKTGRRWLPDDPVYITHTHQQQESYTP